MRLREPLVRELCAVRDMVRANNLRLALERLLYVFGSLSDIIDPANLLNVSTALAAVGSDLHDLHRGRPVAWATRSWAKSAREPHARLPGGREYRDFDQWLIQQLVVVRDRVREGDRRGAAVELIETARECASALVEGEHRHAVADSLGTLLDDVRGLYRGKQADWLLPDKPSDEDGSRKRGPNLSPRSEEVRRTLVAMAYRMHRKLGGTVEAATRGVCRRSGCTEQELRTWCKHLGGARRSPEERALVAEIEEQLSGYGPLAERSNPLRARAVLLLDLQRALAGRP